MRAITITGFGATPALTDQPVPEPGRGEIQVAVEAASTNPLDLAIASGALKAIGEYRFPLTLGMDGAGVVTSVGADVTEFRAGQRVFGQFWSRPLRFGTFAEVVVARETPALGALTTIPDAVPTHLAAALPTAGMTALSVLDHLTVPDGGTLLIIGATGGVGTIAVQAAVARGIRVIATASAETADRMRALGATEVVDRAEPLDAAVRRSDAVLDTVGVQRQDGPAWLSTAANYRLDRKPERLAALAKLAADGVIKPVVGRELPLEDALREVRGTLGKTVLRVAA
ncbi:NADP-dependent oxidoreductase [Streptomyces sp. ID05-26A]|nr:NADP-dependent oxidoreductase [Streptomyces sp. ID05-26A]